MHMHSYNVVILYHYYYREHLHADAGERRGAYFPTWNITSQIMCVPSYPLKFSKKATLLHMYLPFKSVAVTFPVLQSQYFLHVPQVPAVYTLRQGHGRNFENY